MFFHELKHSLGNNFRLTRRSLERIEVESLPGLLLLSVQVIAEPVEKPHLVSEEGLVPSQVVLPQRSVVGEESHELVDYFLHFSVLLVAQTHQLVDHLLLLVQVLHNRLHAGLRGRRRGARGRRVRSQIWLVAEVRRGSTSVLELRSGRCRRSQEGRVWH